MIDVVMTVRNRPFGEWVTVYYAPEKTNTGELLATVKKNGCERAKQVNRVSHQEGLTVEVCNPISAPGDVIIFALPDLVDQDLPTKISSPEGWKVVDSRGPRLAVQTPNSADPDMYEVGLELQSGKKLHHFSLKVELVRHVAP